MVKSKHTAAHVTHVDEVDMTEIVQLREKARQSAEKRGVRLTYLPFIVKALIPALKQYPFVNATLDDDKQEIVLKRYYNIGIATDTEQGLVVPVLRDAEHRSITQLAEEISKLSERARATESRGGAGKHVHNNQRRRNWRRLCHADNKLP
jgi:pyruvate dehydrogenase E2 component (dihydrolipoamide acetyltransferase)